MRRALKGDAGHVVHIIGLNFRNIARYILGGIKFVIVTALVFEVRAETGNERGLIARVGRQLGINTETLRSWE